MNLTKWYYPGLWMDLAFLAIITAFMFLAGLAGYGLVIMIFTF